MSAKVQGWVWDLEVAPQPKLILLWLANRATDAGVCFPTKRELSARTGLSERMVRYHLDWLARAEDEHGIPREPIVSIIERRVAGDRNTSNVYVLRVPWSSAEIVRAELDELKHIPRGAFAGVGTTGCTQGRDDTLHPVGTTGCTQVGTTGCTQNRSRKDSNPDTPPNPPATEIQQQQGPGECFGDGTRQLPGSDDPPEPHEAAAEELVLAFYRGLEANSRSVTPTMRRRDAAIARQLVSIGATAAEAEAYAQQTTQVAGRLAPIDLRSFERERLGWLARRRGLEESRRGRYIDRSGQPPSWQQPAALDCTTPADAGVSDGWPAAVVPPERLNVAHGMTAPAALGEMVRSALLLGGAR